jgi:branched-chain amino acid transport system substrate-binding protein
VPLVAANAAPATLTNALFVWRTSSVQGDAGRSLAAYARQLGPRAYVMTDDSSTGTEEAAKFEIDFEDLGGTILNKTAGFTAPGSISGKLSDARNRSAHTIFACYSGDQATQVLTSHFDLSIPTTLLGPPSLTETIDLAALGPGLPKPVYTSSFYAPDLTNDANRRFVTDYHRTHGLQATGYAMAAYDSAAVLSRAVSLVVGDPTGPEINRAFSSLGQIESPRGTWAFNINRSPQQKWYLRRLSLDGRVPSNLLDTDLVVLG